MFKCWNCPLNMINSNNMINLRPIVMGNMVTSPSYTTGESWFLVVICMFLFNVKNSSKLSVADLIRLMRCGATWLPSRPSAVWWKDICCSKWMLRRITWERRPENMFLVVLSAMFLFLQLFYWLFNESCKQNTSFWMFDDVFIFFPCLRS